MADVHRTHESLVSAGWLAPWYLLGGFVADFRLCHQLAFRFPLCSCRPWTGAAVSPSRVSLSADVRGTRHHLNSNENIRLRRDEVCRRRVYHRLREGHLFRGICVEVEDVVGAITPVVSGVAQVFHVLLVDLRLLLVAEVEEGDRQEES